MFHCDLLLLLLFILLIYTDHVRNEDKEKVTFFSELNQKDYAEYMQSVMTELGTDIEFQNKVLDKKGSMSNEDYVGALNFASSSARNKLDEIKRREIERLNLAKLELKRTLKRNLNINKYERDKLIRSLTVDDNNHIHSTDNEKFTKEDFEKLISQIQHDLRLVDQAREKEYRRHEWKKDLEIKKKLENEKDPDVKSKRLEELKKARKTPRNHKPLNEPGSEEQLKELWRTDDKLDESYFNLKTFFNLHDINQDGHWDIEEVESMLIPEVLKIYEAGNQTGDPEEKYHEIMKMRKHFMEKMDTDKDEIVTYEEYLEFSKKKEFKINKEWKVTEEQDNEIYSNEDIEEFEEELKIVPKR